MKDGEYTRVHDAWRSASETRGPIGTESAVDGMHKCYTNAVDLIEDARLLAAAIRLPRACSLAILAIEELAKVVLIYSPQPRDDEAKHWRTVWRYFRSHPLKHQTMAFYGTGFPKEWLPFPPGFAQQIDRLKQWGFYVDCLDGRFQRPRDFWIGLIALLDLDYLFAIAEQRADSFAGLHATRRLSNCFMARGIARANGDDAPRDETFTKPDVVEIKALLRSMTTGCVVHDATGRPTVIDSEAHSKGMKAFETLLPGKMLAQAIRLECNELGLRIGHKALVRSGERADAMLSLYAPYLK